MCVMLRGHTVFVQAQSDDNTPTSGPLPRVVPPLNSTRRARSFDEGDVGSRVRPAADDVHTGVMPKTSVLVGGQYVIPNDFVDVFEEVASGADAIACCVTPPSQGRRGRTTLAASGGSEHVSTSSSAPATPNDVPMRSRTDNANDDDDDDDDFDDKVSRRSRATSAVFAALTGDDDGASVHCNSEFFARCVCAAGPCAANACAASCRPT
jgi:hypothetical protein